MKYLKFLRTYVCLLLGFAAFTACTSEADEVLKDGKGYVSLSLSIEDRFQTKAVDENDYQDETKYTVQILQEDKPVAGCEWAYPEIPESIELENGSYALRAFYGTADAVSKETPYVEGVQDFVVNNDLQKITVSCELKSAKVMVAFDPSMEEYFSDYSVVFKTKAMASGASSVWAKAEGGETRYFIVETNEKVDAVMKLTDKSSGKSSETKMNVTLSPGSNKKYTLKPKVDEETGETGLGIEITIDDSTNDHKVDITIPSDWI